MSKVLYTSKITESADITDYESNYKPLAMKVSKVKPDTDVAFVEVPYAEFKNVVQNWAMTSYRLPKEGQYLLYSCTQISVDKIEIKENEYTKGHYKTIGEKFTAAANTTTTYDFDFDYDVEMLAGMFYTKQADDGDMFEMSVAPDTVVGAITAPASPAATEIDVSQTVIDNISSGYYVTLGADTYTVVSVDKDTNKLTITPGLVNAVTPGEYVKMTAKLVENMYVYTSTEIRLGWTRIGSKLLPRGTRIRVTYTNVNPTEDKEVYFYTDVLYG